MWNGAKNLTPISSRRPPRPPVNASMLSSLIRSLNPNNPLDATIAAAASVAFWGQCRLGELLSSARTDISTSSRPSRQNLCMRTPSHQTSSYTLFLPRTKTKPHGESITLVSQIGPSDPLHLLRNHLRTNNLNPSSPLFAYATPNGSLTLTKQQFLHRCNSIWSKLGYPRTTGHSFRIGGTTELLLSGVPPDVVKTLGRWSSDSATPFYAIGVPSKILPHFMQRMFIGPVTSSSGTRNTRDAMHTTIDSPPFWGLAAGSASAGRFLGVHPTASPSALRPGGLTRHSLSTAGPSTHPT